MLTSDFMMQEHRINMKTNLIFGTIGRMYYKLVSIGTTALLVIYNTINEYTYDNNASGLKG